MRSIAVATALILGAIVGAAEARELQEVLNTGRLRVGVGLYAPWAARNDDGELVGFEVDVARQLAADMGVRAEILAYDFERLVPALEAGEIDIIAAGLTITPERALHVNFSQPYATGGVALAANLAKTTGLQRLEDLNDPRFAVAAVMDSVAAELARRLVPQARLVTFETAEAASAAVVAGEVDAYLEEEPVPTFLALENPNEVDLPLPEPLLASPAGFAINKGDPDFLAFLNAWITARSADTWLPTTTTYWFGSLRWRERLGDATER
jgi:polar amino acid transport system substrate-binding protein